MADNVEIDDVEVIAQTDAALLVLIDGEKHWIPQSHVCKESEVWKKGDEGKLVITAWIAEKKGLG